MRVYSKFSFANNSSLFILQLLKLSKSIYLSIYLSIYQHTRLRCVISLSSENRILLKGASSPLNSLPVREKVDLKSKNFYVQLFIICECQKICYFDLNMSFNSSNLIRIPLESHFRYVLNKMHNVFL